MVDVQVSTTVDNHLLEEEGDEEDELLLREIEEVAAQFVCLVLEDQLGAQPLGSGKSPAASRLVPGVGREEATSNAPEIARKLKGIGDDLDAKVQKEIREATAELLRTKSVFQIGASQFNSLCSRVLSNCSTVITTGWQQVSTVYLTLSQLQMARQVDTPHPHSQQPAEVVAGRLYHFTRQYINDVGLDTWIQEHGGMATLLDSEMSLSGDAITISDAET